jgi:hypothetical protein
MQFSQPAGVLKFKNRTGLSLVAECVDDAGRRTHERARTELMRLIAKPDAEDAVKHVEHVEKPLVPVQRWTWKSRGDRRLRQEERSARLLARRLDHERGVA